jgi:hypothetical protein
MKIKTTFILAAFATLLIMTSCGAGRKASCDAYGKLEQSTQNTDLAAR